METATRKLGIGADSNDSLTKLVKGRRYVSTETVHAIVVIIWLQLGVRGVEIRGKCEVCSKQDGPRWVQVKRG